MNATVYFLKFGRYSISLLLGLFAQAPALSQAIVVTHFGVPSEFAHGCDSKCAQGNSICASQVKRNTFFPTGRYDFWPEKAMKRNYFISNHDYLKSRAVAMPIENVSNFTIDGSGSEFIFHECILPIAVVHLRRMDQECSHALGKRLDFGAIRSVGKR